MEITTKIDFNWSNCMEELIGMVEGMDDQTVIAGKVIVDGDNKEQGFHVTVMDTDDNILGAKTFYRPELPTVDGNPTILDRATIMATVSSYVGEFGYSEAA